MDIRLSNPKKLTKLTTDDSKEKFFRNTHFGDQTAHQSVFGNPKFQSDKKERMLTLLNAGSRTMKNDLRLNGELNHTFDNLNDRSKVGNLIGTFDNREVSQLNASFFNNFKQYNPAEKPQNNVYIKQQK